MTLSEWDELSRTFYHFSLGLAGLGGASVLFLEVKTLLKIWYLRRIKYPPKKRGERWELIQIKDTAPVYVHDFKSNSKRHVKRHVANPATMVDLGFDWNSIRHVTQEEYDSIGGGLPIITHRK